MNSLPEKEQEIQIAAVLDGGGVYKKGDPVTLSGATKSQDHTAEIHVYKLAGGPHQVLSKNIKIEGDGTFLTQFATNDFASGDYGVTVELPEGTWTRVVFRLL
jgi:hypothetical protein